MAKTNWQDPKSSEIRSTHISGLQEAVGKLEESIGLETVAGTDIPLTEVFISNDDRCRIYQAPEGKRNWLLSPAPVIKKNGVVITDDFEIDYGGGAVIFNTPISESDILTADATYTKKVEEKQLSALAQEIAAHKADYASDLNSRLNGVYKVGRKHFNILKTPYKNIRTNVFKIVTDINSGVFLLKVTGQENTGKPIMFLMRIHANDFSYCKYSSINQETPEIKISKENNNVVLWFNHVGNYITYTFDVLDSNIPYSNTTQWEVFEVEPSQIPAEAVSIPFFGKRIEDLEVELDEHKADNFHHIPYVIATGTNSYAVNIQGITALTEGMSVKVKFTNANTGTATLNINGLGAKEIRKSNGNALSSGNIKAGQICHLVYTGSVFQLLGEGGEYGTAQASDVLAGKTIGTENGIVTGTMPNIGAINQTLTTQGGSYTIPAGYHNGSGKVTVNFANLVASNIKSGVNIGGVVGTLMPFGGFSQTVTAPTYFSQSPNFIKYINGYFVVGFVGHVFISSDGINWGEHKSVGTSYSVMDISYGQSKYIATVGSGLRQSTDLTTWSYISENFSTHGVGQTYSIHFQNGVWVVGSDQGILRTTNVNSSNSWTRHYSGHIRTIACNGTTWVAGGTHNNSSYMISSTDPMGTWTTRNSGFGTSTINKILYANNLFVAVGNDGKISTSTDGISWTARTSNFDGRHIYDVAYGNGIWLAVGEGMRINYSTNGTTWIPMNVPSYDSPSITAIGFGANKFVLRCPADIRIFNI